MLLFLVLFTPDHLPTNCTFVKYFPFFTEAVLIHKPKFHVFCIRQNQLAAYQQLREIDTIISLVFATGQFFQFMHDVKPLILTKYPLLWRPI